MTTVPAGPPGPGPWQTATVTGIHQETPTAKTFTLTLPQPRSFWAGQYFVVRLTAPDGYRAQPSYYAVSRDRQRRSSLPPASCSFQTPRAR
jgi:ferredoxin-NADP reductase